MKLLPLLLLITFRLSAQTVRDTTTRQNLKGKKPIAQLTASSGDMGRGYFDITAEVTIWESGRIEIKGDSLAAIKMLFKALRESSKREMELEQKLFKVQDALMGLVNDWKKANEQLKKDLEKIKPKH